MNGTNGQPAPFAVHDRVTVADGEGTTLGRGTVLKYWPAIDADHDALVEVALDDTGRTVLVIPAAVRAVQR